MRRREAGVTLIEMLVAVLLVSLLSTGILFAMRIGFQAWERTNERINQHRRVLGAQRALELMVAGFMPGRMDCVQPGTMSRQRLPFFQGEPQAMRFLTSHSLEEGGRGYPRIVEFGVLPREDGQGLRLIVNEWLYTGPLSAGASCLGQAPDPSLGVLVNRFAPVQAGSRSFVLADRLRTAQFAFARRLPTAPFLVWVPRWIWPEWPAAVRVNLVPSKPEPGRLQPASLIAPIRVTSDPQTNYVQEQ